MLFHFTSALFVLSRLVTQNNSRSLLALVIIVILVQETRKVMIVRVHLFAKVGILKENAKYFLIIFFSVVRHGVSEFIRYAYIVHPAVQAYAYDSFSGSDLVKGRC